MSTASPAIRISVALVTRNRPDSLQRCLQSWRAQSPGPAEIVVSDDSDPAHAPQMRALAERYGCRYVTGPRRGLYANRNCASAACTGTHVLSADDDHTHPPGFLAAIESLAAEDPRRIWIFSERNPTGPVTPLTCPPELHRSGNGQHPADPSRCAAISDGATLYPREVFDSGMRYDETYAFGALWYLWGRHLALRGWRITFSDTAWVVHHNETDGRLADEGAVRRQLEVMQYALFVNALHLKGGVRGWFWALAYAVRRVAAREGVVHYHHRPRLGLRAVMRAFSKALGSGGYYGKGGTP